MKLVTLLCCLCFSVFSLFAQDYPFEISEPVDVPLPGWNKVVLMRNGNTLLLHFETHKGIIVKVFDKNHKEIASQKDFTKILDANAFDRSRLDYIGDINGEAVVFISQPVDNKKTLVRLNIDAATGKLLKEEKVIQSASFQKETQTHFLKQKQSDGYTIVYAEKKAGFEHINAGIKFYNASHEMVKEIPVDIKQEGYDAVSLSKALINEAGDIMICIELKKIIQYPDKWENTYVMGYLPAGGEQIKYKSVELAAPWNSYKLFFTHNTFANSLNILFSGNIYGYRQNGLSRDWVELKDQLVMVINDDFSGALVTPMKNAKITGQVKSAIDTAYGFSAEVHDMFINKYGLSTIVYRGACEPVASLGNMNPETFRPVIAFTQYDDKGTEVSGDIYPVGRLRRYGSSYPVVFLYKSSIDELLYTTSINFKSNIYVLNNDVDEYYQRTLKTSNDSVYDADYARAICYKLNRKKEVTKSYLLGPPEEGVYKQLFIHSGDYNKETGEYAVAFLQRKGKEMQTKLAWVHFEP